MSYLQRLDHIVKEINDVNVTGKDVTVFNMLLETPIDSYCLIPMADVQLRKNMLLNLYMRNITLSAKPNITGISNIVSDEVSKYNYTYTMGNNYLDDYQRIIAKNTTTRVGIRNDNIQNYGNNSKKYFSNQIYGTTINVYPDDSDAGRGNFTETDKWETYGANKNQNSILKKTKELFRCRKINTIISKFHTDADKTDLYDKTESATSAYGLSHGRNLLTYDAERKGMSYARNGYDNPYCRVWTHHHQYSQERSRLIRPFSVENENEIKSIKNEELHNWNGFERQISNAIKKDIDENNNVTQIVTDNNNNKFGWKSKEDSENSWEMSVLDKKTGLLNIVPKYLGGAEKNVHTKDCMFSIENLAWKGFDPYQFERSLSWEQRGPFGGRIMWFPPYGLRFSEDSSVSWNEHSFIGRGENVYTYTNTSRSGTLEFMMVVDHPSILDYATWHENKPKDTDVLRFFAGCDSGNSKDKSSLLHYVKPTPLTDEYKKYTKNEYVPDNELKEEPTTPSPDQPIEINFCVFFPNNYSGYYDREEKDVDPIAYLLFGNGAQYKSRGRIINESDLTALNHSLFLGFNTLENKDIKTGKGYEMNESGTNVYEQEKEWNYIIGTSKYESKTYIPDERKKWYYRIDGKYEGNIQSTSVKNCFGQTLSLPESYQDKRTYRYNLDVNTFFDKLSLNKEKTYSLAEIAYVIFNKDNKVKEKIEENSGGYFEREEVKERIKVLTDYIGKYKIIEIKGIGYSNSHDKNNTPIPINTNENINKKQTQTKPLYQLRNEFLAEERCNTVIKWLKHYCNIKTNNVIINSEASVDKGTSSEDESGETAKLWRSAVITLKLKKRETQNVTNDNGNNETILSSVYDNLPQDQKAKYEPNYYIMKNEKFPEYEEIRLPDLTMRPDLLIDKDTFDKLDATKQNDYIVYQYILKEEQSETTSTNNSATTNDSDVPNNPNFQITDIQREVGGKNVYLYKNTEPSGTSIDAMSSEENSQRLSSMSDNRYWYYDETDKDFKLYEYYERKYRHKNYEVDSHYRQHEVENKYTTDPKNKIQLLDDNKIAKDNRLRYDQEYHFFKKLEANHPAVFSSLVEKLQYFDPAFHSMTPEGFMGRLNFLHQCTRQGDTLGASEANGYMANNLAFGRPPFCILRIGDFYYQKIVIKNININYDPLVLDLNNEGIGVVPLIANVTISFNFIGGGDLTGPVRRLQNALSFNYYANGRLYDNRADRIAYKDRNMAWDTMQNGKIDFENSYIHHDQL